MEFVRLKSTRMNREAPFVLDKNCTWQNSQTTTFRVVVILNTLSAGSLKRGKHMVLPQCRVWPWKVAMVKVQPNDKSAELTYANAALEKKKKKGTEWLISHFATVYSSVIPNTLSFCVYVCAYIHIYVFMCDVNALLLFSFFFFVLQRDNVMITAPFYNHRVIVTVVSFITGQISEFHCVRARIMSRVSSVGRSVPFFFFFCAILRSLRRTTKRLSRG